MEYILQEEEHIHVNSHNTIDLKYVNNNGYMIMHQRFLKVSEHIKQLRYFMLKMENLSYIETYHYTGKLKSKYYRDRSTGYMRGLAYNLYIHKYYV